MTSIELNKCARALVKCGYAIVGMNGYMEACYYGKGERHPEEIIINPYADTPEGIAQAHALEDWFIDSDDLNSLKIYLDSRAVNRDGCRSEHDWRLKRLQWSMERVTI